MKRKKSPYAFTQRFDPHAADTGNPIGLLVPDLSLIHI